VSPYPKFRYATTSSSLGAYNNFTPLSGAYISDFFADLRTGLGATGTSFAGTFGDLFALTFGGGGRLASGYYMGMGSVVAFFATSLISFGGSICCILSIVYIYMRDIILII